MRRSSSAAFCASRSAIRRLISAAENIPAVAGFAVPRLSDMISLLFPVLQVPQRSRKETTPTLDAEAETGQEESPIHPRRGENAARSAVHPARPTSMAAGMVRLGATLRIR